MIVKDGSTILLTEEDIQEYAKGNVSTRLQEVWGIKSYEELKELLQKQNHRNIDGSEIRRTEEVSGDSAESVQGKCS